MFETSLPIPLTSGSQGHAPGFSSCDVDPYQPFALTLLRRAPVDLISGSAQPLVLARLATLAEAMRGAIEHAEGAASDPTPQLVAILDRDECLVLGGVVSGGAVAWCRPVMSAAEARGVVTEASHLRARAGRAADWDAPALAHRLRYCADLLDARLVDPIWRAFAARALRSAA